MDLPFFLQGPWLGYSWIDAISNIVIYGLIAYLLFSIALLVLGVLIPIVGPILVGLAWAIECRAWYLLVYILPFLPQIRAHMSIWQALLIATGLAILLYVFVERPLRKRRPIKQTRTMNSKSNQPSTIQSVNTDPVVMIEGKQPIYTNDHLKNPLNQIHKPPQNKDAFDQIVGMEKAKTELRDAIELPLIYPQKIKQYDLKPASGLIFYGPPGTGKTALARASASYFGAEFFLVNATSLVGQFVGTTEAAVKEIFQKARSKTPSIIFFDEIDAIGAKRDGRNMNRPSDIILNLLLTELDGFEKRKGVFVIAATNRIDILDEALLRPGRFEIKVEVPAPNEEERLALLKFFGKKKPLGPNVNLWEIAKETEGFTGAYLEGLVNSAAKRALKRSITSGWNERITYDDFMAALPDMKVSNL